MEDDLLTRTVRDRDRMARPLEREGLGLDRGLLLGVFQKLKSLGYAGFPLYLFCKGILGEIEVFA